MNYVEKESPCEWNLRLSKYQSSHLDLLLKRGAPEKQVKLYKKFY